MKISHFRLSCDGVPLSMKVIKKWNTIIFIQNLFWRYLLNEKKSLDNMHGINVTLHHVVLIIAERFDMV